MSSNQPLIKAKGILKNLLQNNPKITQSYLGFGITVLNGLFSPLQGLMKHLLNIKAMHNKMTPQQQADQQFQADLNKAVINIDDDKDFDDDFDDDFDFSISWGDKSFQETQKNMKSLNLTKEKFMELTDVSRLNNPHPYIQDLPPPHDSDNCSLCQKFVAPKSDIKDELLNSMSDALENIKVLNVKEYIDELLKMAKKVFPQVLGDVKSSNLQALKDLVKNVIKDVPTEKVVFEEPVFSRSFQHEDDPSLDSVEIEPVKMNHSLEEFGIQKDAAEKTKRLKEKRDFLKSDQFASNIQDSKEELAKKKQPTPAKIDITKKAPKPVFQQKTAQKSSKSKSKSKGR